MESEPGSVLPPIGVVDEAVASLETDLGLPAGFYNGLMEASDDWSFVVKASALAEAALTHLVEKHFEPHGIASFVSELTVSSKLKVSRQAGLLDEHAFKFGTALSQLRNSVVHDVRRIAAFSISGLAAPEITPSHTLSERLKPLLPFWGEKTKVTDVRGMIRHSGRQAIWLSLLRLLLQVYTKAQDAKIRKMEMALAELDRQALLDALGEAEP